MAHTHELLPATGGGVIAGCGFALDADETAALIGELLEACEALVDYAHLVGYATHKCGVCDARASFHDLLQHQQWCPAGKAAIAIARARGKPGG